MSVPAKRKSSQTKKRPAKRIDDKKLDRLDRIRAYLFGDLEEISEEDKEMLTRYRKAWGMASLGYPNSGIVYALENEYGIKEKQAYAIMGEAAKIYGNIKEMDAQAVRKMYAERFDNIALRARKKEQYDTELNATDKSAKISGAYERGKILLDPKDFLRPVAISFESDPAILKAQQTEDIDHEVVDEDA